MKPWTLEIVATVGGRTHLRGEVLAWENRRIDAAARKVGVAAPPPREPVEERRQAWLEIKQALGPDELLRRLARDLRIADLTGRLEAKVSRRRRRSVTELLVPGGSAAGFTTWFREATAAPDRTQMERACPDHFVLRVVNGRQQVVETNGGSPFAASFDIDYEDVSSIVTPVDPRFTHRIDGVARASDGSAIGAVRHQFRDVADGVHARLAVEFPLPILGSIVRGHRWHLACEFSNWFEAAVAAERV